MALSIFEDKNKKPESKDIIDAIGDTGELWDAIKDYIAQLCTNVIEEWKFYGKSSGWTLLLKHKKRTILYLFPSNSFFIVLFVFGEKAIHKAYESSLPNFIIEKIKSAVPYLEGRSFQIEVRDEKDIEYVKKLIEIKIEY